MNKGLLLQYLTLKESDEGDVGDFSKKFADLIIERLGLTEENCKKFSLVFEDSSESLLKPGN